MPPADRPDKLSVVVYSGYFDRVHYALVMATAAAATGTPATLFFTMGALRALIRDRGDGPGWRAMPVGADAFAGERAPPVSGGTADERFRARGVAGFEELLEAARDLGVRLLVCEMGLRAVGMARTDLRADLAVEEGGVVTFLADASRTGAIVFV